MFRPKTARKADLATASSRFALYVEGPRDRDVLRLFAQKLSPELARAMDPCVRILGGRQPGRAEEMFGQLVESSGETNGALPRGLCILDRDDPQRQNDRFENADLGSDDALGTSKLEFVVWKRRQIESYLLVPHVLSRCVSKHRDDPQFAHILKSAVPDFGNEQAFTELDAKRVLGARGPIASYLGRPLRAQEIIRNMTPLDIHADVKEVLARVRDRLGTDASASLQTPAS